MPSVDEMIDNILRREGGFVNHENDRGGATNFGITQKTLSGYLGHSATLKEVEDLSVDVAKDIYERNYYIGPRIDRLPEPIQPFIFDCAINHGPRRAIKFVQSISNQLETDSSKHISEDGAMGPNTRKAAERAQARMGSMFLQALLEERRNFYRIIVESDESQLVFLNGWMNRVDEFEQEAA